MQDSLTTETNGDLWKLNRSIKRRKRKSNFMNVKDLVTFKQKCGNTFKKKKKNFNVTCDRDIKSEGEN